MRNIARLRRQEKRIGTNGGLYLEDLFPDVKERSGEEPEGHEFVNAHQGQADVSSHGRFEQVECVGLSLRLDSESVVAGDSRGQSYGINICGRHGCIDAKNTVNRTTL